MLKSIVSSASLALGIALPATAAAQGAASGGAVPAGELVLRAGLAAAGDAQGQAVKPLQPLPDPDDDTPPPPPPRRRVTTGDPTRRLRPWSSTSRRPR